ncbi:hypothetical protein AB205_0218280 [Aquarana catesbeiana]|uniref:Uncharacterized protein n=1 Tax=Aquarana catesbeiana TaxID=8400 RepID=A0A2G9SKV0_AQUCT|nr:hypothetical protein AB205_0218280 [Aquarana catesbeiana]
METRALRLRPPLKSALITSRSVGLPLWLKHSPSLNLGPIKDVRQRILAIIALHHTLRLCSRKVSDCPVLAANTK